MPYEQTIIYLDEQTVLAECGPMRLTIQAWKNGKAQNQLCQQAAEYAFSCLESVANHRTLLSQRVQKIHSLPENDLEQRMIESVKVIGDPDLTPMAAVAGTIADFVADWLFDNGPTKVVVDNGGDIAIRLAKGETASVGIRPQINRTELSHIATLDNRRSSWGITTSGLGGRSFTRGIASAVTVLAENSSLADAASTAIANDCFVEDSSIIQVPAGQIDLNTDIAMVKVTVGVGVLNPAKKAQAVQNALSKANAFCRQKLIIGALIALEDIFVMTPSMEEFIST